jgi:hypothetical protein
MKPEDFEINEQALDVEWLEHANKHWRVSKRYAEAVKAHREAVEEVKTVRSQLLLAAANDPSVLGGAKPTVGNIEAWYRTHHKFREVREAEINAQFVMNIAEQGLRNMHNRRVALENLVALEQRNYFAGPSVPRDLSKERQAEHTSDRAAAAVKAAKKRRRTT